jgi:hypothetical protein
MCAGLDGGHLALNYWYHPPDNLDPGRAGFSKPYTSPFYPTIWANRRGWVQAETHKWWQQQQQHLRQQLRMKQPQQQQQPQQPRQPKQQEKQQQQQGQQCGTALGKRRRIQWAATVGDPGNVYAAFNTRPGTATGSCTIKPKHSGRRWGGSLVVELVLSLRGVTDTLTRCGAPSLQ